MNDKFSDIIVYAEETQTPTTSATVTSAPSVTSATSATSVTSATSAEICWTELSGNLFVYFFSPLYSYSTIK